MCYIRPSHIFLWLFKDYFRQRIYGRLEFSANYFLPLINWLSFFLLFFLAQQHNSIYRSSWFFVDGNFLRELLPSPFMHTQHGFCFIFKRRPFFDTGNKENKLVPHWAQCFRFCALPQRGFGIRQTSERRSLMRRRKVESDTKSHFFSSKPQSLFISHTIAWWNFRRREENTRGYVFVKLFLHTRLVNSSIYFLILFINFNLVWEREWKNCWNVYDKLSCLALLHLSSFYSPFFVVLTLSTHSFAFQPPPLTSSFTWKCEEKWRNLEGSSLGWNEEEGTININPKSVFPFS
jgi:hypothetical protein